MKAAARFALTAILVLSATLPALGQGGDGDDIKNCFNVHGEARYGALAYKHIVIVTNSCDISLKCQVWTDVDPSPKLSTSVGPKGTSETIVRNNSPSRVFKAFGECKK